MRRILAGIALFVLVGCGCGRSMPAFSIQDVSGKTLTNDDLKGKVVLIDYWASWCKPCLMTAPILQYLHREFADRDMIILGIPAREFAHERL